MGEEMKRGRGYADGCACADVAGGGHGGEAIREGEMKRICAFVAGR